MPFSAERFDQAQFTPRTKVVDVEVLASFFDDNEAPAWTVRGLSASELHRAMEASNRKQSIESIIKAIAGGGDQVEAMRKALGLTLDTPGEIAKRLEMLTMGSVSPKIELPTAVKLAQSFPIEFLSLTNAISELTGMGADVVKPTAASQPTVA